MEKSGLPIEFVAKRGFGTLTLAPEINNSAWDVVEKSATQVIAELGTGSVTALIVDLTPLSYLGSAQVALLVRVWKALNGKQGKIVIHVTSPVVRDVLKTAGLSRLWQFVDNKPAAYEYLEISPEGDHLVAPGWLISGGVATLAAGGLGAVALQKPELMGIYGGVGAICIAAAAVLTGGVAVFKAEGKPRFFGILIVLLGLGVIGEGCYAITRAPAAPQNDSSSGDSSGITSVDKENADSRTDEKKETNSSDSSKGSSAEGEPNPERKMIPVEGFVPPGERIPENGPSGQSGQTPRPGVPDSIKSRPPSGGPSGTTDGPPAGIPRGPESAPASPAPGTQKDEPTVPNDQADSPNSPSPKPDTEKPLQASNQEEPAQAGASELKPLEVDDGPTESTSPEADRDTEDFGGGTPSSSKPEAKPVPPSEGAPTESNGSTEELANDERPAPPSPPESPE